MPRRRNNSSVWYTDFRAPDGKRIRVSTGTRDRKQAKEYEDRLKAEQWRISRLGDKPRRGWQEAAVRWLKETEHKRSRESDLIHLRHLDPELRPLTLDAVTRDVLERFIERRKAEGVSNATINRSLEVARAILGRAYKEWQWLDSVPHVRTLDEGEHRIRWLSRDEADRLLAELPTHLAAMCRFTLATGLREANVVGLEWSQVDLERRTAWIHPDQAKAKRPIGVPLNREAVVVLREQQGWNTRYVFTYQGQPVDRANNHAWRKALKRAAIEDFRWHDLRHTWASWHIQNGTPLHVLKELGGWSDIRMVLRYAHLAPDHLAEYQDALASPRLVTVWGTPGNEGTGESG